MKHVRSTAMVLQVLLSISAGALGAWLYASLAGPSMSASPSLADGTLRASLTTASPARFVIPSRDPQTQGTIEERLRAIEESISALSDALPHTAVTARAAAPSIEAEQEASRVEQARLLNNHNQEPVDRSWSATTSQRIANEIETSGTHATMRAAADCRSTSCWADVSWQNADEAQSEYVLIPQRVIGDGCLWRVGVPSASSDGLYRSTLYVDCASARATSGR